MECANCRVESKRVAMNSRDLWVCAECSDPWGCTCGLVGVPIGIDRFTVPNADSDEYGLNQCVTYRCANGHTFGGPRHYGPGALWPLAVTPARVAELEARVTETMTKGIDAGGVIVGVRRDFGDSDGVEVTDLVLGSTGK